MSIHEAVKDQCQQHHLHHIASVPGVPPGRELYVASVVHNRLFNGPWQNDADERRWAYVAAQLIDFVVGAPLRLRKQGCAIDRRTRSYMLRLNPGGDEVWEIRSAIEARPQLRLFGRFAEKDLFVALTWRERNALVRKRDWREAMDQCASEWRRLLDPHPPFTGRYPHDYLSHAHLLS